MNRSEGRNNVQTSPMSLLFPFFCSWFQTRRCSNSQRLLFKSINRTLEMIEAQKRVNLRQSESEWKDELRRGRWKREKLSGPSIFIAKTYEILEVTPIPFRPINTPAS